MALVIVVGREKPLCGVPVITKSSALTLLTASEKVTSKYAVP